MALQYMFLGQLLAKNTKNDKKKTFWKITIGQKIKTAKMGKFSCSGIPRPAVCGYVRTLNFRL